MNRVLVTGINGFVGEYVAHELIERGLEVVGVARDPAPAKRVEAFVNSYHRCDLMDEGAVDQLPLETIDAVISLAGLTKPGESFEKPQLYNEVNVGVLAIICRSLVAKKLSPHVLAISSGAVYDPDQPMPLTENSTLVNGGSPYAKSKVLMEKAVYKYRRQGLRCTVARPFNHTGPHQQLGLLVPDMYKKLTDAATNGRPAIFGNLNSLRDYTDVRDVARAYVDIVLASKLESDVYNVCSGQSRSVKEISIVMLKALGLGREVEVQEDASTRRPDDPQELYGSYELLHQELGWQPIIPFEQTIQDFVSASSK